MRKAIEGITKKQKRKKTTEKHTNSWSLKVSTKKRREKKGERVKYLFCFSYSFCGSYLKCNNTVTTTTATAPIVAIGYLAGG